MIKHYRFLSISFFIHLAILICIIRLQPASSLKKMSVNVLPAYTLQMASKQTNHEQVHTSTHQRQPVIARSDQRQPVIAKSDQRQSVIARSEATWQSRRLHGLPRRFAPRNDELPPSSPQSQPQTLQQKIPEDKNLDKPLLALLHTAIAEQQVYPESAAQLNQTGKVTLGFILYPNGEVSEIKLLKSSGVASLDEAALKAVNAISPVNKVEDYLKEKRSMEVDVVFE